jgi:hypothetical protein
MELPEPQGKGKGGHMKKQAFSTFTILGLLLLITAVSVHAQYHRGKTVTTIPFDFIVGDKTLPAGEYRLQPNRSDSQNVWLLQSRNYRANVYFLTMSVQSGEAQEKGKLVFRKYGDQYFLSQIWRTGDKGGRELVKTRREHELAKNSGERQTIVLATGSRGKN